MKMLQDQSKVKMTHVSRNRGERPRSTARRSGTVRKQKHTVLGLLYPETHQLTPPGAEKVSFKNIFSFYLLLTCVLVHILSACCFRLSSVQHFVKRPVEINWFGHQPPAVSSPSSV